jgi:hypothetical protein
MMRTVWRCALSARTLDSHHGDCGRAYLSSLVYSFDVEPLLIRQPLRAFTIVLINAPES